MDTQYLIDSITQIGEATKADIKLSQVPETALLLLEDINYLKRPGTDPLEILVNTLTATTPEETKFVFNFEIPLTININLKDSNLFVSILMYAINKCLPAIERPGLEDVLNQIFPCMINSLKLTCPLTLYKIRAFNGVLEKGYCRYTSVVEKCEALMNKVEAIINASPFQRVVVIAHKILNHVLRTYTVELKKHMIQRMSEQSQLSNFHRQIIITFLLTAKQKCDSEIYEDVCQKTFGVLASKLDTSNSDLNFLKRLVPLLLPNSYKLLLNHIKNSYFYIRKEPECNFQNMLYEFTRLTVKYSNFNVYDVPIDDLPSKTVYDALLYYWSVQYDEEPVIREKVMEMISSPNTLLHRCGIELICKPNKRSVQITEWQCETILTYFKEVSFKTRELYPCIEFLFSQLFINIHDRGYGNPLHIDFFERVLDFCLDSIGSKTKHHTYIGCTILDAIERTSFMTELHTIYSQKKFCSAVPIKLQRIDGRYNTEQFWYTIVHTFCCSEMCLPSVFKFIFDWFLKTHESCALYDEVFQTVLDRSWQMVFQFSFDASEKAHYCIRIYLLRYRCTKCLNCIFALPDHMFSVLFNQWINQYKAYNGKFNTKQVYMRTPLISVTKCLLGLSGERVVANMCMTPGRDVIFKHCVDMIREFSNAFDIHTLQMKALENIKLVAHTILGIINLLVKQLPFLTPRYSGRALRLLTEIIHKLNIKVIMSTTANHIRDIATRIMSFKSDDVGCNQKKLCKQILEEVLNLVKDNPDIDSSTLRKQPQYSRVIHALILSGQNREFPFLKLSMDFLIEVVQESPYNNSRVAALNAIDKIMSDATLKMSTLPYVEDMAIECLNHTTSPDFAVRNATQQVLATIVLRIFGNEDGHRHSVTDMFSKYPKLSDILTEKIQDHNTSEMMLTAVVSFFTGGNYIENMYYCAETRTRMASIKSSFLRIMVEYDGELGQNTANAYVALTNPADISLAIQISVSFISFSFSVNYVKMLFRLVQKFRNGPFARNTNDSTKTINTHILSAEYFLNRCDPMELASKYDIINTSPDICTDLLLSPESYSVDNPNSKLWLKRSIPYALENIDVTGVLDLMKMIISFQFKHSIVKLCTRSLLQRNDICCHRAIVNETLVFLFDIYTEKLTTAMSLFCLKVFLKFIPHSDICDDDMLHKIRRNYEKVKDTDLPSMSITIIMLSHYSDYNDSDNDVINNAITIYENCVSAEEDDDDDDDYDDLQYAAETLKYLYKCAQPALKPRILKMCLIMLLNKETQIFMLDFIANTFNKTGILIVQDALETLLNRANLIPIFQDEQIAQTFLEGLASWILTLHGFELSDTYYYLKEYSDVFEHKPFLLKLLPHVD